MKQFIVPTQAGKNRPPFYLMLDRRPPDSFGLRSLLLFLQYFVRCCQITAVAVAAAAAAGTRSSVRVSRGQISTIYYHRYRSHQPGRQQAGAYTRIHVHMHTPRRRRTMTNGLCLALRKRKRRLTTEVVVCKQGLCSRH